MIDVSDLEKKLCAALCADIKVVPRQNGANFIVTPFTFPDGDVLPVHVRASATGGLQLTDMGSTLMRLSYDLDADTLREGARGRILRQIVAEFGLNDANGEFIMNVPGDQIGIGAMRFMQALTRISDISFLARFNVESTFYEDLARRLNTLAGGDNITPDYIVPGIPMADDYPVDFYLAGGPRPLYVFGVPNRDKARLSTIVIQHLDSSKHVFESAVIFRNADDIPRQDFNRLVNVANDVVTSIDATDDVDRKIRHRLRTIGAH